MKTNRFNFYNRYVPMASAYVVNRSVIISAFFLMLVSISALLIADTISTTNKYAWSENAGWLDFNASHAQVQVFDTHLEGYVWGEGVGWIRLGTHTGGGSHTYSNNSATTYGVNNDGSGNLSGYGWGENIGWVNFNPTHSQVTIDSTSGDFDGYAWSEGVGWIHFQNTAPAYKVQRLISTLPDNPDGGNSGGTITFTASGGQILSNLSVSASGGNKPAGMSSVYGDISYQVTTAAAGGTATVTLQFSTALPAGFSVYKVDTLGNYTVIPQTAGADGFWVQVDANTISITLTDGGAFDLDEQVNSRITDPIAILVAGTATPIPTLSWWGLLLLTALLGFMGRRGVGSRYH